MAKKETIENIEYDIADVIIGRPQEFKVGRKTFCFYPITLAKMLLLKRQLDCLELNMDILRANPFLEALRVMKEHRETVCTILSYMTAPNTYKDLYDSRALAVRRNVFNKDLGEEDLASLLVVSLDDKTDRIMRHLGLDKEHEKLQKVMKVKKKHDDNSLNFCGLSLFGTFIGQLKEMGYSDNEILYEKGYTYLRLMLADKIVQVILTDDEKKELPSSVGGSYMDANDPKNAEKIRAMFASRGVEDSKSK